MKFSVKIYVWRWTVKKSAWGIPTLATSHASLEVVGTNESAEEESYDYLSFWPVGFHFKPGWQDGIFNPGYGSDRQQNTIPHRYPDTVFMAYHRRNQKPKPDYPQPSAESEWAYELTSPSETTVSAIRAFIAIARSSEPGKFPYHIILNNCSSLIAIALSLGGLIGNDKPCGRFILWSPAKIKRLCDCLTRSDQARVIR
jgi:hypothetical protein